MTQTTQHVTETIKFNQKTFTKFPEPMTEFSYECQETKRGIYGHSIQYENYNNGDSVVKLKIYGVQPGKLTMKSEVVISEDSQNEPISSVPISKLLHAHFLLKCLQQQASSL